MNHCSQPASSLLAESKVELKKGSFVSFAFAVFARAAVSVGLVLQRWVNTLYWGQTRLGLDAICTVMSFLHFRTRTAAKPALSFMGG